MRKPLRKCAALLISFLMALTLLPAVAWAADVNDWSEVMTAVGGSETNISLTASTAIGAGTYNLKGKTVTFSGTATISGSVTITNGTILRGADNTGALFKVGSGSSLTLENVIVDGANISTGSPLIDAGEQKVSGGSIVLNAGTILRNNICTDAGEGGAITLGEDAKLEINGAVICNNEKTDGNAGAIKAYAGAKITMNSGEIYGNEAYKHGGAIQIFGGDSNDYAYAVFTMNGGTIYNNTADGVGGGVAVSDYSSFIMNGGEIKNNSTTDDDKRGGGVGFADKNTTMQISGSATITGNTAGGATNNLYIGTNTNNLLKVTGALSGTIGITATTNRVFTKDSNFIPADYITCFTSDDTTCYVAKNEGGQLLLKQATNTITISDNLPNTADAGGTLSISASADSATPTYQWYSCTDEDKSGATAISGAMSSTYTVPTDLSVGDHYYFCRVSAKEANPVDSNVLRVTVEEPAVIEAKWGASASNLTNSGTLSDAFAASPAYIQLQTSVMLNEGITVLSGTTTLDLNGKTITGAAGIDENSPDGVTPITVNGGTLTLVDSVGGGSVVGGRAQDSHGSNAVSVENGTLNIGDGSSTNRFTLKGGDSESEDEVGGKGLYSCYGTVNVKQAFTVESGQVSGVYDRAISSWGTFNGNGHAITVKGSIGISEGSAYGLNAEVTGAYDALIVSSGVSNVTISGGSYIGTRYGLWIRGSSSAEGSLKISGGTFGCSSDTGEQAIKNNGSDTYAELLADGCYYTDGENDASITDETTLASAKKLAIKKGGSSTEYSVVVSVEGIGGTANGGGTYNANETATVTATAKTGYRFVKWTENGNEVSTDAAYSFAVTANRTLVAVFELIPATPVAPVDPDPQSPPAITSPTTDQEVFVYVNSNATMSIDAKDAKTYQWYVDRGNGFEAISGATDASYTTSKVELKNDGYRYYCVATNAYGTDISPIFTLNVTKDIVTPKTGDNAQNGLWTGLIMIAAAGLCACTVVWRKRSQA